MGPGDVGSPAPIDRPVLEELRDRLRTTAQVANATITRTEGHLALRVRLAESYYPDGISAALLVRWYTNDDCKVHYRERHEKTEWEQRWDRHPNPHNTRDHFHPPPDATTPGDDADWPEDYREMVGLVLDTLETRINQIWKE